jgi:hypothetical protein
MTEKYPVAVLDEATQKLLGAGEKTVQLTGPNARDLPDLPASDLAQIQETIEHPTMLLNIDGDRYALLPKGDKIYTAVLSGRKGQISLESFQILTPAVAEGLKARGTILKQ